MIVKMKTQIGGFRNGEVWPLPGDVIDVPDHEAARLLAAGYAEESSDDTRQDDTDTTIAPEPDAAPTPEPGETPGTEQDAAPEAQPVEGLDREELIALADELGATIDRRWGADRIRDAISEAG